MSERKLKKNALNHETNINHAKKQTSKNETHQTKTSETHSHKQQKQNKRKQNKTSIKY